MVKDDRMFIAGRCNFAALLSSDDEEYQVKFEENVDEDVVVGEGIADLTLGEAVESGSEESEGEEDEWCPVVSGKKKVAAVAKDGVSSNPGTGKGANRFPSSFTKSNHSTIIGNGAIKKPLQTSQLPALTLAEICDPSKSLELFGFPSKYRTGNLRKFVEAGIAPGAGYRLKWQNDSSCWVVFDEAESCISVVRKMYLTVL